MLCQFCQRIKFEPLAAFLGRFPRSELPMASATKATRRGPFYYPHRPSAEDLRSAGDAGCHLCAQMWYSFGGLEVSVPAVGRFWLECRLLGDESVPSAIRVSCGGSVTRRYVGHAFLDVTLPKDLQLPLIVTDPLIDTNTGSVDNLRLARSWLDECINKHKDCRSFHWGQTTLPTRVIDVSSQDIRLHEVAGEIGRYAILSHCWGKHPIITTVGDNLKHRCSKIPLDELCQTFQDAVAVTRALDLQYLWIDSLCIIQDSALDWETESSRMGRYYAAAHISIAAMDARDGSIGCFVKRNPLSLQPCRLNIQLHGSEDKVAVVTSQVPNHRSRTGELNRNPRFLSSLDTRAWCLQEGIMSSRILCFGWQEMSWICTSRRTFEGFVKEGPTATPLQADCFQKLHDMRNLITAFGSQCKHNIWFDIVEQYTERNLTYTSDMLPGLSGLASEFQTLNHDDYLAGLWKHDFARGLVWRTPSQIIMKQRLLDKTPTDEKRRIPFAKRPAEYRAPSWSWASIDNGFVNWDHVREFATLDGEAIAGVDADADKHAETCVELVESTINLQGANPFGQVRDGSLKVRGLLKRAEVWEWEEGAEGRYVDDANVIDPSSKALIGRVDADDGDWAERPVWCLPVIRDARSRKSGDRSCETFCLALMPVEFHERRFMRIGIVAIRDDDWFAHCERIELTIV